MGKEIRFVVYGQARPEEKKTARAFLSKAGKVVQPRRYESGDRRDWKADVRRAAAEALSGPPMEGPVHLTLIFFKTPSNDSERRWVRLGPDPEKKPTKANRWPWAWFTKPDENNLSKPIEDACSSVVWEDDAQIIGTEKWKVIGDRYMTLVRVREVAQDEAAYKRAWAEGVICELQAGCGADEGGLAEAPLVACCPAEQVGRDTAD